MPTDNSANSTGTGKKLFKKGQSGNPSGRPKKSADLAIRCRDMTDDILDKLETDYKTTRKIMERLEIAKLVLAYGHGKPTQRQEITGADGGPVQNQFILPKEVVNMID